VGNGGCNDQLPHGTPSTIVVTTTDGHNRNTHSHARATQRLAAPPAPTCVASASPNNWVGATVRFTSNGSLSRTSVRATSTGWWSATATATRTDGFNIVPRQNSCGVRIENPPGIGGPVAGAASAVCNPFRHWGSVIDGLNASVRTTGLQPGWVVGGPVSGSFYADHGTHISGTSQNLQCVFWRRHHAFHIQHRGLTDTWNAGVLWHQSPHIGEAF